MKDDEGPGTKDEALRGAVLAVRAAGPDDAIAIHDLLLEFNGEALSPTELGRRMEHLSGLEIVFLGTLNGQVAGLLALRVVPSLSDAEAWCEITEMYVRPPFRRRGMGTALVRAALEHSRGRGCVQIHLLVDPSNYEAHRFYDAAGFRLDSWELRRDIPL